MEATPSPVGGAWVLPVLVAVVALLLAVVFLIIRRSAGPASVIIIGPSGSGKTALFHRLRDGDKLPATVTSMEVNEDSFILASEQGMDVRPVHMVDLPGHPRLRFLLDKFASSARGIIFVVDSTNIMPQIRTISEQLFEVLAKPQLAKSRVPVMLGCNKADLGTRVHTVEFIQKTLEKEIDSLRSTRGTLDGSSNFELPLLNSSKPFSFANSRSKITIGTLSATTGDVGSVESFVRICIPAK